MNRRTVFVRNTLAVMLAAIVGGSYVYFRGVDISGANAANVPVQTMVAAVPIAATAAAGSTLVKPTDFSGIVERAGPAVVNISVTVKLTDRREFKAKVLGVDKQSDIAVIRITAKDLPTVQIGNPALMKVASRCWRSVHRTESTIRPRQVSSAPSRVHWRATIIFLSSRPMSSSTRATPAVLCSI